jgi:hypothetical protein
MRRITQSQVINTSVEKVWAQVFEPENFTRWTEVFTKGSYYEGSLEEGSSVRFLAKNTKGQIDGMVGEIAENKKHKFLSIRHLGWVFNGKDDTTSEEVKSWAPAYENYRFESLENGQTRLTIEADLSETYYEQFEVLWPKALQKIKELCEGG